MTQDDRAPVGNNGFAGKVAIVTGGTSGIGRALALGFAQAGGLVCAVGRDSERIASLVSEGKRAPGTITGHAADLAEEGCADRLRDEVQARHGRLDILIHSAGEYARGRMGDLSAADTERMYRVNTFVPAELTGAMLVLLRSSKGDIVFINSSAGLRAVAGVGVYSGTKHALRALADAVRDEVNADGIRVLSVYCGRTATRMQEDIHHAEGRAYDPERLLQPHDVAAVVLNTLALPRTAEITDLSIRPHFRPSAAPATLRRK